MQARRKTNGWLIGLTLASAAFWLGSHQIYARWQGVPPVPSKNGARMMTLGDTQFSYRFGAITLQNLGDGGGDVTPIKNYDFPMLGRWFHLLNDLDPASNHVPMIAAYYFGATPIPNDVAVVVDYLSKVGQNPYGNKWRWLAQAVYLAQYRMDDKDLALDLAYKLARMQPIGDDLPIWARQMPVTVLKNKGEKQAAQDFMRDMMSMSEAWRPDEIATMRGYMLEQLGMTPAEVDAMIAARGDRDKGAEPRKILPAPAPD
jgi:hypothetical protein